MIPRDAIRKGARGWAVLMDDVDSMDDVDVVGGETPFAPEGTIVYLRPSPA